MTGWEPRRYSLIDNRTGQRIEEDDPVNGFVAIMHKDLNSKETFRIYANEAASRGCHQDLVNHMRILSNISGANHPHAKLPD